MSSGWSECVRTGGCCFLRTISTMRDDERCSNSFIIMTWLKCDSFTTKFRQCSFKQKRNNNSSYCFLHEAILQHIGVTLVTASLL